MKNKYFQMINCCEVCQNKELIAVLDLGLHPMCDDLIKVKDDRVCGEYPIEILYCSTCNTAHQKYQVPKHELFPNSYHYRSRFTSDVLFGMSGLVDSCCEKYDGVSNKIILDIGCNDGSLLDFFRKKGGITIGIEPTGAASDAAKKGHHIYQEFLSEYLAEKIIDKHGHPDVITFTNVFAHIEDLNQVLRSLKILMNKNTKIIIENHYLGSILDGAQFDTFYHEHPRTYSYTSFLHVAKRLNALVTNVEFPSRYGGNIRVFIEDARIGKVFDNIDQNALAIEENSFYDRFSILKKNIDLWRISKLKELEIEKKKYGALRAKAFPGRAAILIKMLNLTEDFISAVYEKPGSLKIGHYIPGTRIPICSDDELFELSDQSLPIINLAWHIPEEIKKYLSINGYKGRVINIFDASSIEH